MTTIRNRTDRTARHDHQNAASRTPPARGPLFPLGRTVATPGALAALQDAGQSAMTFLMQHVRGDWGDVPPEDAAANEAALRDGERIFSAYQLPKTETRIWIITEWDRSVTTILLPEEY